MANQSSIEQIDRPRFLQSPFAEGAATPGGATSRLDNTTSTAYSIVKSSHTSEPLRMFLYLLGSRYVR
jgi:hypothetical protein